MTKSKISLLAMLCCIYLNPVYSFSITGYSPSLYQTNTAAMDTALSIDGSYQIEDFEDTTLIPGLTVRYSDNNTTPLLNNSGYAYSGFQYQVWDGAKVLSNYKDSNDWKNVTFEFTSGVKSFAIGLACFETGNGIDHIYINNNSTALTAINNVTNYQNNGTSRNFYIKIEAGTNETINSVFFDINNWDYIAFDHLAVQNIPEPGTILLLAVTLLGITILKKNKE